MKKIFSFTNPLIPPVEGSADVEVWRMSLEQFDNKEYLASFHTLMDYINPSFKEKYGNNAWTEFNVPHGSIVVNIKIDGDNMTIFTPFLELPEQNRVPLMRQVASLNDDLILAQIILKDDKLNFHFSCPMAMAHPHKIFNIIYNICHNGDKYDDEFVTKFDAKRIYEPQVTPYDSAKIESAYQIIQQTCEEGLEAIKDFESKRSFQHLWGTISITLCKILYAVNPQGQLLNEIEKAIKYNDRDDISSADMASSGKAFIEKLKGMTMEQIAVDLYSVEQFVSNKNAASVTDVQEYLEGTADAVRKAYDAEDYLTCAMRTTYIFYKLYYDDTIPSVVDAVIVNAMTRASEKSLSESSKILLEAIENIMDGNLKVSGGYMKKISSLFGGKKKK